MYEYYFFIDIYHVFDELLYVDIKKHIHLHLIELEHFKKTFDRARTFQETFDRARTFQKTFDRARTFQNYFDRARTFARTFDRGVVRGANNHLKFCRLLLLLRRVKMIMNFLLCRWKKWNGNDEFFISGEEKSAGVIFLFNSTFT